jgi:hypothetical protein
VHAERVSEDFLRFFLTQAFFVFVKKWKVLIMFQAFQVFWRDACSGQLMLVVGAFVVNPVNQGLEFIKL